MIMPASDITIKTIADELLDLVRKKKKISVEEASKKLKIPLEAMQSIVDFLVEEKVFGIEYKFTTPYIYMYSDDEKKPVQKSRGFGKEFITKEQFFEKAKAKSVPYEHIEVMWRKYLQQNLSLIREEFFKKAKEKGAPQNKVDDLWRKYLSYL